MLKETCSVCGGVNSHDLPIVRSGDAVTHIFKSDVCDRCIEVLNKSFAAMVSAWSDAHTEVKERFLQRLVTRLSDAVPTGAPLLQPYDLVTGRWIV